MKNISEADCLALVELSPTAVAVHDKSAWMDIFASCSLVEDPVGSSPHICGIYDRRQGYRSKDKLSHFYDTFIAPNQVRFHIDRDIVSGLHVMRDLTIEIIMSPQITVHVPVHLLYELTLEGDELKVFRLAAHWELWPMLRQQMAAGWPFAKVGSASAYRMLRHLGVGGMAGFLRALSSVGTAGKQQLALFARYLKDGDATGLAMLFINPGVKIALPHGASPVSIYECAAQGGDMQFDKVLAAGNIVSATMVYDRAGVSHAGVALFELDKRSLKIVKLTCYWGRQ